MNRIKAKTKDGKTVILVADQRKPRGTEQFNRYYPAAVKHRAVRAGLTLVGKRQGR